ncbi:hypothetical protein [Edwardsiella tarda]|uniref:hypothetical protein n=1 Tax=Edwardsiella tarda TaxID=636 RepID=UPI0002D273E3|nr:hypothetical protein [Edwardsiella tarda]
MNPIERIKLLRSAKDMLGNLQTGDMTPVEKIKVIRKLNEVLKRLNAGEVDTKTPTEATDDLPELVRQLRDGELIPAPAETLAEAVIAAKDYLPLSDCITQVQAWLNKNADLLRA